jgi:hypothetical protein
MDFESSHRIEGIEIYTESESTTFDDEDEAFLETFSASTQPSISLASNESLATSEERRNGLVLSLEMVQFLRKSAFKGNIAGMISRETMNTQPSSTFHHKSDAAAAVDQSKKMNTTLAASSTSSTDLLCLYQKSLMDERVLPSPKTTLEHLLKAHGRMIDYRKYTDVPSDYFVKCDVSPHSLSLLKAVRDNDLATLRHMHEVEGLSLQCSNKFQESLVHTVARHGLSDMLLYMKHVAGVSLRVCCDGGRNALHDACWTSAPNFDVVRILIQDSPDLLYIIDKRSFSPLDYIPKEAYGVWNEWLLVNKPFLLQSMMKLINSEQIHATEKTKYPLDGMHS